MKLFTTVTSLLLSTTLVSAAAIDLRDEGGPTPLCIYMTNGYGWKGESMNFCKVGGQCGSGLGKSLAGNVSSAGPPKGQTCFLYDGPDCTGHGSEPIVYPGYANLSDPAINFDNRAKSWRCWKHCGYVSSSSSTVTKTSSKAPITSTSTVTALTTVFSLTQPNHGVTVITQTQATAQQTASTLP
ncbi:hypothetical protein LTR56_020485 [Elasticomyces elasticus]|nr:hypothetical protein LTR56_020485 [Elasticomyces elasticus]KAK3642716.1 hypothetical protein LTR22_015971 [Elasticomyces elasticus]KAK4910167.1 hypothetical protein LTR49_021133 [Elasticomyces elasticus]KAK5766400.1 hypothetical protein LTS12_003317 [Elasticomyces elasticus]